MATVRGTTSWARGVRWLAVGAVLCGTLLAGLGLARPVPAAHADNVALVGPLEVSGTKIVDLGRAGAPVVLQGVNVDAQGPGPYVGGIVDADALQTLEDWGANFVRLELSSNEILQQCPDEVYDADYRSQLAQAVADLTAAGIYVLLDIHSTDPDCDWDSPQASGVAPLPGEDAVGALEYLSATYGADPLVGFEPFNEPEACAEAPTGIGATLFEPAMDEPGGACGSQALADIAWSDPGTAFAAGASLLGLDVTATAYPTPGMDALYAAVMDHVPSGTTPLIFMDANYWAADASSFADLGSLSGADNIVEVFHPYDCQDTTSSGSIPNAICKDATPETCSTTAKRVAGWMTDPATGAAQNRPVVFDELNFPAGEALYQGPGGLGGTLIPLNLYQHGLWMNNMIAAMQQDGAAGWAVFAFQNADVDNVATAYSMTVAGITPSSALPWTPSANDAPAVTAMGGQRLSCQNPPLGYDAPL